MNPDEKNLIAFGGTEDEWIIYDAENYGVDDDEATLCSDLRRINVDELSSLSNKIEYSYIQDCSTNSYASSSIKSAFELQALRNNIVCEVDSHLTETENDNGYLSKTFLSSTTANTTNSIHLTSVIADGSESIHEYILSHSDIVSMLSDIESLSALQRSNSEPSLSNWELLSDVASVKSIRTTTSLNNSILMRDAHNKQNTCSYRDVLMKHEGNNKVKSPMDGVRCNNRESSTLNGSTERTTLLRTKGLTSIDENYLQSYCNDDDLLQFIWDGVKCAKGGKTERYYQGNVKQKTPSDHYLKRRHLENRHQVRIRRRILQQTTRKEEK
jgi:hypothetical protein